MTEAYNLDCMTAMKAMPDNAYDLAIVDPPYGIGCMSMNYTRSGAVRVLSRNSKNVATRRDYRHNADWDIKPGPEYFAELFRVSRNQIVWGGNYFSDMLPPSKSFLVWDKRCADQMRNDFADCEYAWMSEGMGVARIYRYLWNGMLQGDMKRKQDRIHPTEKPIALYKWILQNYAKPGYKILDTHLGSGASRIAAWEMGYDFTGYEIDREYFEAQEKRFKAYTAQLNMFVEYGLTEGGASNE